MQVVLYFLLNAVIIWICLSRERFQRQGLTDSLPENMVKGSGAGSNAKQSKRGYLK